jgi:putative addiction module CopG family antidote
LSYQIPPDIDALVQAQLATGEYASADAVLRDAMATLERRQRSLTRLQEMVREAEEDVAAGRVGRFDAGATMQATSMRFSESNARS